MEGRHGKVTMVVYVLVYIFLTSRLGSSGPSKLRSLFTRTWGDILSRFAGNFAWIWGGVS